MRTAPTAARAWIRMTEVGGMDKPKCPYCGAEMELDRTYKSMIAPEAGVTYWYSCDVCGSESPRCNTPESAYAAAMRRYQPENETLDK